MSETVTEDEVVLRVARLTRERLVAFVEAELVTPLPAADDWTFRPVDLARLELLCDLAEGFDLDGDALGVVIGLIDRLHEARASLRAIAEAIAAEPGDVQARVGARLAAILAR